MIISALRLESLLKVDMTDVTYTVILPILWSALEPCVAITLACIPLLRPLFGRGHTAKGSTVELNAIPKSIITIGKKSNRKFNKLYDESSMTELATETEFRPESVQYDAKVRSNDGRHGQSQIKAMALNNDVEPGIITIKKDWKVESGTDVSRGHHVE